MWHELLKLPQAGWSKRKRKSSGPFHFAALGGDGRGHTRTFHRMRRDVCQEIWSNEKKLLEAGDPSALA
jgi:hypothetical protein